MDRENTPQKQRQKRSSNNRRNSNSSTAHGTSSTSSRASMSSISGPPRAFRGSQRPRSRTAASGGPPPVSIMSKTPSMLLRPPAGGAPGSTGVLYEPDAPDANRRNRHSVSGENYLQVNTRVSGSSTQAPSPSQMDRHSLRAGSPGRKLRPHTPSTLQQTKIVPPSTSVKLITPQMQFSTDLSVKLGDCLELTNFTVVGVIGLEGVGKSTVLSLLAQKNVGEEGEKNIFSTRSLEAVVLDRHETTGVDLAISMVGGAGHPTILLDSQPLLSSSMLVDLLDRNEGALTPEQQVEAASYQIAVFLCAICHYVVVVHDGLAFQVSVSDLLRKIEQKFAQCRLPSVSGNSQRHAAQLLYVANNLADSELLYRENELFSAHDRALEALWSHSLVRVPYKMSSYSNPADDKSGILNVASFVLPHKQQQLTPRESKVDARSPSVSPASGITKEKDQHKTKTTFTSSKYSDFDEAAKGFQRFMLSLPSSPSFTSQPMMMAPGSSPLPPPHALSLREWLSNASRVFEAVRKASCFTAEFSSSRDHH
ncbi:Hypothetical protein PHPALM_12777 [Phytophthora palmivora]|uniref:Protein SMG9 n=1 Tax=Phytophthora palmivora TaxID=4796 RepID=A0A2P4XYW5_9STRA|nr:Hypothetical protein PHPALM_12777 [Phytophthora palmivora]